MSRRLIVSGEAANELIAASPTPGFHSSIGARRILVKRFPYSIVFIEHAEDLWVIAFAHHHRRPGYWRERLET